MNKVLEQTTLSIEQQRIIELASNQIRECGLANFRIDTLCKDLGYTRQNLYRYFPGKKAVLNAVIVQGSVALAESITGMLTNTDAPFDEQLIEGMLIACDIIYKESQFSSYSGNNLAQATTLFLANADAVQSALQDYLEPVYQAAQAKGELYESMSYEDLTKWLFQTVLGQIAAAEYESRESRRTFLLKMFSPSINAQKARALTR